MSTNEPATPAEIVYGAKAISRVVQESNLAVVYYRLEQGYYKGAWKAGDTWAMTVPVFRRSIGLDEQAA